MNQEPMECNHNFTVYYSDKKWCILCENWFPLKKLEPMDWESSFDTGIGKEIKADIDFAHREYCMNDKLCNCITRYEVLKHFISLQIKQAEERGQKEARCHYYDLVREKAVKDERERIVKEIEKLENSMNSDERYHTLNEIKNLINQNNE